MLTFTFYKKYGIEYGFGKAKVIGFGRTIATFTGNRYSAVNKAKSFIDAITA